MSISSDSAPDDLLLRRYLLGLIPETESEKLDERSIADEEFVLLLRSAEYDLADAYAAGELSGDELEAFQRVYLSSAAGRDTIRFADTLLRYHERPGRLWATWALAAAALVLLATSVFQLGENRRLRRDVAAIRAETVALADRGRRLQQQLAERAPSVATRADTTASRGKSRVADLSTVPAVIASFVLAPAVRGADAAATIAIPAGNVRILLSLEADRAPSFDAVLKDSETRQVVWHGSGFQAIGTAPVTVAVTVPADVFKTRGYVLELNAVRPGRDAEPAGRYPFRVTTP
jgi:hypothetical protein